MRSAGRHRMSRAVRTGLPVPVVVSDTSKLQTHLVERRRPTGRARRTRLARRSHCHSARRRAHGVLALKRASSFLITINGAKLDSQQLPLSELWSCATMEPVALIGRVVTRRGRFPSLPLSNSFDLPAVRLPFSLTLRTPSAESVVSVYLYPLEIG